MSLSEAFKSHSALAVVDLMSSVRSAKSSSAWPHRGPMPLGSQCLQPLGISWPALLLQTTPPAFPAALTLLEAQVFPFGALDPATRHRPGVFSGQLDPVQPVVSTWLHTGILWGTFENTSSESYSEPLKSEGLEGACDFQTRKLRP